MGLFSRLFSSPIEAQLLGSYSGLLRVESGVDTSEAKRVVSQALDMCKELGAREGTSDLGPSFGTALRRLIEANHPQVPGFVKVALSEGAKPQDIEELWNLHDLQRRMLQWHEVVIRTYAFNSFVKAGQSELQATLSVGMVFPFYGDPREDHVRQAPDRVLPTELRNRVEAYSASLGADRVRQAVQKFSSYNAFVRAAISQGLL